MTWPDAYVSVHISANWYGSVSDKWHRAEPSRIPGIAGFEKAPGFLKTGSITETGND